MPTLVLPPRYTPDSMALGQAAGSAGWDVERLASWRVPDWLVGQDVVIYGEPLFAAVVAEPLDVALLEPPFGWLPSLPSHYRQRSVELSTLSEARSTHSSAFIKPADDKCFAARLYASGSDLPHDEVLPPTTPVLIAEPVVWEIEFRCFILDRAVVTLSPYLRDGQLARSEDGHWFDERTEQATEFAERFVSDTTIELPPSVVVDVGIIRGRGWAVLEANAAWGSGIYGSEPTEVIRRACVPRSQVTASDRSWIISRTSVQ